MRRRKMKRQIRALSVLLLVLVFAACSESGPPGPDVAEDSSELDASKSSVGSPPREAAPPEEVPTEHSLTVVPRVLESGHLSLSIRTDIPGTIEVMAGISLQGQADDDVWVGNSERVRIRDGEGAVTLSTSNLPSGTYDAEVSFYPRWGFQDSKSRASGISEDIVTVATVELFGSGESTASRKVKDEGQKWVMENVTMGDPWRPAEWLARFGNFEKMVVDRGNPKILKAYYFATIDVTIIANELKGEISIWRLGRARH